MTIESKQYIKNLKKGLTERDSYCFEFGKQEGRQEAFNKAKKMIDKCRVQFLDTCGCSYSKPCKTCKEVKNYSSFIEYELKKLKEQTK